MDELRNLLGLKGGRTGSRIMFEHKKEIRRHDGFWELGLESINWDFLSQPSPNLFKTKSNLLKNGSGLGHGLLVFVGTPKLEQRQLHQA